MYQKIMLTLIFHMKQQKQFLKIKSYLAIHVAPVFVALMGFLHLLPQLFISFVSNQPHSHCHQSPSQWFYPSMMMNMMVPPFWRVWVGNWVNTCRRNSWISTWRDRIRLRSHIGVRHYPWRYTGSQGS